MKIVVVALLFLSGVSRAQPDYEKPGFWNRVYKIPQHFETYRLRLTVPDARAAARELQRFMAQQHASPAPVHPLAISWTGGQAHWPTPSQFLWDASTGDASGIVAELGHLGAVSQVRHDVAVFGDLSDLSAKEAGLENAAALLKDKVEQFPATTRLIDAEAVALQPHLEDYRWALGHSLIYVTLVDSTTKLAAIPEPSNIAIEFDHRPTGAINLLDPIAYYTGHWARSGIGDPCRGKPHPIQVDLQAEPGSASQIEQKAEKVLFAHGAARTETKCMPDAVNGIHYDDIISRTGFWMTRKQLAEARPELSTVSHLILWEDKGYEMWTQVYASAAERHERLTKELREHSAFFKKNPLLRSLVQDEIQRLSAPAKIHKETEPMAFVEIILLKKAGT